MQQCQRQNLFNQQKKHQTVLILVGLKRLKRKKSCRWQVFSEQRALRGKSPAEEIKISKNEIRNESNFLSSSCTKVQQCQRQNLFNQQKKHQTVLILVGLKRFELPTFALEGHCSIQLSYKPICMERVKGIGPSQPAWKAGALPLSYTRITMLRYDSTRKTACQQKFKNIIKKF